MFFVLVGLHSLAGSVYACAGYVEDSGTILPATSLGFEDFVVGSTITLLQSALTGLIFHVPLVITAVDEVKNNLRDLAAIKQAWLRWVIIVLIIAAIVAIFQMMIVSAFIQTWYATWAFVGAEGIAEADTRQNFMFCYYSVGQELFFSIAWWCVCQERFRAAGRASISSRVQRHGGGSPMRGNVHQGGAQIPPPPPRN